ncbi:MAG: AI-2E family transporter [Lachnospiraceae bacterium]|nr:AI-2E family transporter [Lachnospiraceae bacterium]
MQFKWDRKYLYWGLTAFAVILGVLVIYLVLTNLASIFSGISYVLGAFRAVIYGIVLAYLLNPLVKLMEFPIFTEWGEGIFKKKPEKVKGFTRALAVTLTMLIVVIVLALLLWMVLPKLYESIITLVGNLPSYLASARKTVAGMFTEGSDIQKNALSIFDSLKDSITGVFSTESVNQLRNIVTQLFTSLYGVARELVNLIVGFVVSVYVMMNKEKFCAQAKKFLYAHLRTGWVTRFLQKLRASNHIFIGFIGGKIIDSLVIGISCYIMCAIFRIPYKELVSVLVGVTNMIPFFGPFIGAIPSALIILMVDPIKSLTFLIIIIVLQQLDGNILQPRILGHITGLNGFWVLVSLVVGGYFFGVIGMLLAVPFMAIIYAWIKTNTETRLKKRGLVSDTDDYKEIAYIEPATKEPVYFSQMIPESAEDPEDGLPPEKRETLLIKLRKVLKKRAGQRHNDE